ncbi:MAG: 30S ribosomal protein S1 [Desulfomonilia bacterium]
MSNTGSHEKQQSMAELLDSCAPEGADAPRVGSRIRGRIVSIGKESVFVDTGSKIDGIVDIAELLDEDGELPCTVGDEIELYIVSVRRGEIKLSRALSGIGGEERLREAYQGRIPVEGRVTQTCKGGFSVEVVKHRAFCPVSQIDTIYVENPEEYVGKTLRFLVTELSDRGKNIVLSRRSLMEQEEREAKQAFLETLSTGTITAGRVSRIVPYGAFVELSPGVEGMVHISEMSWSRIGSPEEILRTGDEITVKVIGIEEGPAGKDRKISLSMKQAGEDPWTAVSRSLSIGDRLTGTVTRCMDYGAFVELRPGVEGLVHVSEMSYTRRISKPADMVAPGDTVEVMVKDIDPVKRRISLSMKDAEGDPWIGIEDRYRKGQRLAGVIEKKEKFGFFISLEPGITGLLPRSKIMRLPEASSLERMQPGESIPVVIEALDAGQRRITLAPGNADDEDDWKKFSDRSGQPVSSLGEKLRAALGKKA